MFGIVRWNLISILGQPASTKNREKKEGSRQTTLFAMLPKTDKSSRTTKKSADSTSLEPPQKVIHTELQSTEVTMSEVDVMDSALETQDSVDWEETQPADESHTALSDVTSSEV